MSTITQTSPTADSVSVDGSEVYTNQIEVSGATGALYFATTSPSEGVIVEPNGYIETAGSLSPGSYTVLGTVTDVDLNLGDWIFTLNVVGALSPATTLVPTIPVLPSGVEIAVPFQIDPATGAVAVLTDYVSILEQHIATIVMTMLNERVMLPQFGSTLQQAVFSSIQPAVEAFLAQDLQQSVANWEPAVNVQSVKISSNPALAETTLVVIISFTVVPFNSVNTVTVAVGGTIAQVSTL